MDKSISYYDLYAEKYYRGTVNADMSRLHAAFLQYLEPPAPGPDHRGAMILDAGCGSGRDSLYFLSKGYQVVAFDASVEMVKKSSRLLGQEVMLATFEEFQGEWQFDGIWACASLLHLEREKVPATVKKLAGYLKPRGTFYMSFKYGEQDYQEGGRHFSCYREGGFSALIAGLPGLEVVEMFKTADVRPGRPGEYWLNCFVKKTGSMSPGTR